MVVEEKTTQTSKVLMVHKKDWKKVGEEFYGKDMMNWELKCPSCGHVQSEISLLKHHFKNERDGNGKELTIEEILKRLKGKEKWFYISYECEGRVNKGYGCHYVNGGFIQLHELLVMDEGYRRRTFLFANDEANKKLREFDVYDEVERIMEELKKRCEDAGNNWDDFAWDNWIPEKAKESILRSWNIWERTPMSWFKNRREYEPTHGERVKRTKTTYDKKEYVIEGRYLHRLNGCGLIITDEGEVEHV